MRPTETPNIILEERPQYIISAYLYEFIGAAVENTIVMLLDRISKVALHEIHSIYPPPAVTGNKGGKDLISMKKLQTGCACWST